MTEINDTGIQDFCEKIQEHLNNMPPLGSYNSFEEYEQALIQLFHLLDIREINVRFYAYDDTCEYTQVEIESNTYPEEYIKQLYESYPKEMARIEAIVKDYLDQNEYIEIDGSSNGSYVGECGILSIHVDSPQAGLDDSSNGEEEIQVEKYSYPIYVVSLCSYVTKKDMDAQDVDYLVRLLQESKYDCDISVETLDTYQNTIDISKKEKAIQETIETILRHGIVPNGMFTNKEIYKLADILLKYAVLCKQKTEHIVSLIKEEGLALDDDQAKDPELIKYILGNITYPAIELIMEEDEEEEKDKLKVEIRYHINLATYEPLDEMTDLEFDACDESDTFTY